ncbi:pseudouridine synthase [endosymbiont of Euscepes postfasciatus]|uniref:RluA family pseudouridine synthase n=1 Tax=endosymbiont of Euscepes postfasciatus TaxID=650377 RepID=UPI000DC6E00E|nr:RluA family pseudouridine synthase [endosymbiont of Euscepes postfasciatus]BBA84651.1 pseudouridine synthase [endosymbiont of Euscepes postfasciatus]
MNNTNSNIINNINIIYEDEYLFIINKPCNLIVNLNNKYINLINIINNNIKDLSNIENNGLVHRLDKNTTGLIIIAKNNLCYFKLKKLFYKKKIYKEYIGVVTGEMLSGGSIYKSISRDKKRNKMCINEEYGKKSITYYKVIKKLYLHTLIKINIITGRTHQIRVHMSNIGYTLVGDKKYINNNSNYKKSFDFLKKKKFLFERQALHSYKIKFIHPITKKNIKCISKCPDDINKLIKFIEIYS